MPGRLLQGAGLAIVMLAATAANAEAQRPTGKWSTNYGPMIFGPPNARYFAVYTSYEGGRLIGAYSNGRFIGIWVQKGSANHCGTGNARDGSEYWGRIELRFNRTLDKFSGKWSYCNAAPATGWAGERLAKVKAKPKPPAKRRLRRLSQQCWPGRAVERTLYELDEPPKFAGRMAGVQEPFRDRRGRWRIRKRPGHIQTRRAFTAEYRGAMRLGQPKVALQIVRKWIGIYRKSMANLNRAGLRPTRNRGATEDTMQETLRKLVALEAALKRCVAGAKAGK